MKRSEITNTLLRLVGPLVFLAGMMACITIGEPLGVGLTWRNVVALCAIPWICGYAGYNMGWIKGQYAGWIKSRDEFRPNKMMERPEASDGDSWVETIRCPACGMINTAHVHFEDWMPFPAYVHVCEKCGYIITESEWEVVDDVKEQGMGNGR